MDHCIACLSPITFSDNFPGTKAEKFTALFASPPRQTCLPPCNACPWGSTSPNESVRPNGGSLPAGSICYCCFCFCCYVIRFVVVVVWQTGLNMVFIIITTPKANTIDQRLFFIHYKVQSLLLFLSIIKRILLFLSIIISTRVYMWGNCINLKIRMLIDLHVFQKK